MHKKMRTRAYRFSGGNPAFPAQWFYGLLRALPGDRAFLPPSPADVTANLTPASGRQDHTTSPSAGKAPSSSAPLASTASCPASVTISSRPSVGQDGASYKGDLGLLKIRIFLQTGLDRLLVICPTGCFVAPAVSRSLLRARRRSWQVG
jgi:hypothetical protein